MKSQRSNKMYSIKTINIMDIDDFKNHPYRIEYDEEMD